MDINPRIKDIIGGAAARGLGLAAEHVLGESNKDVPHEEATLERSGATSLDERNLQAVVSYDTPYAVVQHEDMTLNHDNGRTAKYLENAMNAETDAVREIIAKAIKKEL
ncbi:hypothetical protein [Glutamicibacter arilaitensis]|uniref:hypothetical protein n=1 Tax=Glutamicibacter arilaitensis TaxID=256701 RepID=UPI00384ABE0C